MTLPVSQIRQLFGLDQDGAALPFRSCSHAPLPTLILSVLNSMPHNDRAGKSPAKW